MYSHSGATLSKMLECLVNVIAKCKLSKFAIVFCHSKKMYNVTTFFCDLTNVRSKLLLLGHLPNLVGHCPMSDSNLQPWVHILCVVKIFWHLHVHCKNNLVKTRHMLIVSDSFWISHNLFIRCFNQFICTLYCYRNKQLNVCRKRLLCRKHRKL
jgi:hypothetical protein